MVIFKDLQAIKNSIGAEIGTTEFTTITQEMINDFAKATHDFQWIHVDEAMAKQYSPFQQTVAHGFLTLALAPKCLAELLKVESVKMALNYGANKIRFTAAVPAGSKVSMKANILEAEEVQPKGLKVTMNCIFEIEGQTKPVCIAELISVFYE